MTKLNLGPVLARADAASAAMQPQTMGGFEGTSQAIVVSAADVGPLVREVTRLRRSVLRALTALDKVAESDNPVGIANRLESILREER